VNIGTRWIDTFQWLLQCWKFAVFLHWTTTMLYKLYSQWLWQQHKWQWVPHRSPSEKRPKFIPSLFMLTFWFHLYIFSLKLYSHCIYQSFLWANLSHFLVSTLTCFLDKWKERKSQSRNMENRKQKKTTMWLNNFIDVHFMKF
jgi:hypothetical protein